MKRTLLFVTGTDTGVGKTVLTCLLARHFYATDRPVAALKPLCSGDRSDAIAQRDAIGGSLTLDEINPWHFRRPLTPLLAARAEKRVVTLAQVTAHVRRIQKRFPVVLIEGAGGLLSPLGESFDSRDLIKSLRAKPMIVGRNQLGALNQVRLVLAALPARIAGWSEIVLMNPKEPDVASRSNPELLGEIVGRERIHVLPWLASPHAVVNPRVRRVLDSLIQRLV